MNTLCGVDVSSLCRGPSGEGQTSTELMMEVQVPLISKQSCMDVYEGRLDDGMICAGDMEGGADGCRVSVHVRVRVCVHACVRGLVDCMVLNPYLHLSVCNIHTGCVLFTA